MLINNILSYIISYIGLLTPHTTTYSSTKSRRSIIEQLAQTPLWGVVAGLVGLVVVLGGMAWAILFNNIGGRGRKVGGRSRR